jgi:hypothetical protein
MNIFFIEKSKPAMDEFIKSVAKSIGILNYEESEGELVFPTKTNPKKDVTKKIIKTVMDNAGISDYQIAQREIGTSDEDGKKVKDKPGKPTIETATLTTTLFDEIDAKDLEKKLKKQFTIPNAKYEIKTMEDEDGLDSYKQITRNMFAIKLDSETSNILNVPEGSAGFKIISTTLNSKNIVTEISTTYVQGYNVSIVLDYFKQ